MNQNEYQKTTPIIFQGWKIEKILAWDFQKNGPMQTRRIARIPSEIRQHLFRPGDPTPTGVWTFPTLDAGAGEFSIRSPYGVPGDSLWVKETWASHSCWDKEKPSEILFHAGEKKPSCHPLGYSVYYFVNDSSWTWKERGKLRTSLFMPRAASRIKLRILDIHPERLFSFKESDALPEGWDGVSIGNNQTAFIKGSGCSWYFDLWDKLNGDKSPETSSSKNPWVWKITFEKVG